MGRKKTTNNNKFVTAKIMGLKKGEENIYFEISKYEDGKSIILEGDGDSIRVLEGKLVEITLDSYEYEGKTRPTMMFKLNDGSDTEIHLKTAYTQVARQIIYSLSGLDTIDKELQLSLYISKKGNKNIWVRHGGEDLMNPFDWEKDIKSKQKAVMDGDEFVRYNNTKLDKRTNEELIPNINSKIVFNLEDELERVESNPTIKENNETLEDEDLPF